MNFNDATASIIAFFNAGWADLTPVAWPDTAFITPEGQTWARVTIKHNEAFQASMGSPGSNRFRRNGIVIIQIFQPQGQASKDARAKADAAVDIFLGQTTSDGIIFSDVGAKEIGPDGAGWHQINVTASFRYDRIT